MISSLSQITEQLNDALREDLSAHVTKAIEKAIEDYQKKLPEKIVRACRLIETHMFKNTGYFGTEIRFVIHDRNEVAREIAATAQQETKE